MDLNGIPAVVTGGGSGLGAATAELLAGAGSRVAVVDLDRAGAERVAARVGGIALECDVCDPEAAAAAFDTAREAHGGVRVLVSWSRKSIKGWNAAGPVVHRTFAH